MCRTKKVTFGAYEIFIEGLDLKPLIHRAVSLDLKENLVIWAEMTKYFVQETESGTGGTKKSRYMLLIDWQSHTYRRTDLLTYIFPYCVQS